MKFRPTLALLLLSLTAFLAVAPVHAVPNCSATGSLGGDTYSVSLSPCSSSGVPLNTGVVATASTTDTTVTNVEFDFYNPSSVLTYSPVVSGSSPFSTPTENLNAPGTWQVVVTFYAGTVAVTNVVFDIQVQILVLNALPFGAIAAAGVALAGFFLVRRYSKKAPEINVSSVT